MTTRRVLPVVLAWAGLLGVGGCGAGGPTFYPVGGRLELPGGDVGHLAGSVIEAVSEADPAVRASGEIGPDGRFTLDTLHDGTVRRGAREGRYKVRVVLADDDPAARRRVARAVAPRFLRFETSGLSVQVPAAGDVRLSVSAR